MAKAKKVPVLTWTPVYLRKGERTWNRCPSPYSTPDRATEFARSMTGNHGWDRFIIMRTDKLDAIGLPDPEPEPAPAPIPPPSFALTSTPSIPESDESRLLSRFMLALEDEGLVTPPGVEGQLQAIAAHVVGWNETQLEEADRPRNPFSDEPGLYDLWGDD